MVHCMYRLLITLFFIVFPGFTFSQPEPILVIVNEENQKYSFTGLQFTPDGEYLISVIPDTRFRSVDTWEIVKSYPVAGNITAFSKDGSIMVYDGTPLINNITNLINLNTGEFIIGFDGHNTNLGSDRTPAFLIIGSYAISNDNRFVVSVANDQQAILWNVETGEEIHKFDGFDEELGEITDFKPGPTVFSPDGSLVAFRNTFWSTTTFKKEFELLDPENTQYVVISTSFSHSNIYFYTTANDGYIRIWDWENKSLLLKENFDFFIQKAEISFDNRYLVVIGNRNFVKIIDLAKVS